MSAIDWNTELRRISRQFDGPPPAPPRVARPVNASAPRARARTPGPLLRITLAEETLVMLGAGTRLALIAPCISPIDL